MNGFDGARIDAQPCPAGRGVHRHYPCEGQAGLHAITRLVFRMLVIASFPIGLVVFTVIIGLVYYGVFTPMALAFRLVGRDALNRRPDRGAKSYWFKRPSARPARSYFKLY